MLGKDFYAYTQKRDVEPVRHQRAPKRLSVETGQGSNLYPVGMDNLTVCLSKLFHVPHSNSSHWLSSKRFACENVEAQTLRRCPYVETQEDVFFGEEQVPQPESTGG